MERRIGFPSFEIASSLEAETFVTSEAGKIILLKQGR